MNEPAPALTLASVIVLKIPDYTLRPVAEQARLKAQLQALVAGAIEPLPALDRIVLDAPGGLAIVVLAGPQDALGIAERAQAAAAELPLGIGVNHGPVTIASDACRGSGLVGDGIAACATLADAAGAGRLLVSRSFQETLAGYAPERAERLVPAGTVTDTSVRTHQIYALDRGASLARRRRLIAAGTLSVLAILALGIAARRIRLTIASRPAVILFDITPHGDVFVDGAAKGRSPPLTRLEVRPGAHVIEVRNSPFPPLRLEVNLRSDEEITIRHSFRKPKKQEGVVDRWRRKFGL